MSNCDIAFNPVKFLKATVLSFNTTLGLGSSESTLNVELIEDCESSPPDSFMPKDGSIVVGAPVYFTAGQFNFGGTLQSWNSTQSGSGKTFSATVTDPRQLLTNVVVVTDSYLGPPAKGINYFNVYAFKEGEVLDGNCEVFGTSQSNDRGMPCRNIINILKQMNPVIYSPTGYAYTLNFNGFGFTILANMLPEYFRIPGPSITILQLLENACDVLGYEFYVNLLPGAIIDIGLIDLKAPPTSFEILTSTDGIFNGKAIDLSYGQELRNEITKTVLFGEQQHYLSRVTNFGHFFGEDLISGVYIPVTPHKVDDCGFWVRKKIDSLNKVLTKPFPNDGPYELHELDIRCAMSSMDLWRLRTFDEDINGSFNKAVRELFPDLTQSTRKALEELVKASNASDFTIQPNQKKQFAVDPKNLTDLEAIYNWVKNLGNTYYGKQFITPLNQRICYYFIEDSLTGEKFFSDIPTNAGGWVDDGIPVLDLTDPDLTLFREEDGRIGAFAMFNDDGLYNTDEENTYGQPKKDHDGNISKSEPTTPSPPS